MWYVQMKSKASLCAGRVMFVKSITIGLGLYAKCRKGADGALVANHDTMVSELVTHALPSRLTLKTSMIKNIELSLTISFRRKDFG